MRFHIEDDRRRTGRPCGDDLDRHVCAADPPDDDTQRAVEHLNGLNVIAGAIGRRLATEGPVSGAIAA